MRPVMRRSLLLLLVATAAMVLASTADARCIPIKRHQVPIAKGASPSGFGWKVDGTIGNNGNNCHDWLFGMSFELEGATNWSSGTGIPAGGHLGRHTSVESSDNLLMDGSDRVFSGTVSGEVAKVLVTLSNDKHLVIHPKLPPEKLRQKVVWLRDVKYFVFYYPPEGFVTGLRTFSRAGQLLYREKEYEGF